MRAKNLFQAALASIPHPPELNLLGNGEFFSKISDLERALSQLEDDEERTQALRQSRRHPAWQVRSRALEAASRWLPLGEAEETILDLTHDSVDVIAFQAIRLCGEHRLRSAVTHLARISGWPSNFQRPGHLRKPVGIGAAFTKRSLVTILGSEDPDELKELEEEILRPYREILRKARRRPDIEGMVHVPGGPCTIGTYDRGDFRFHYKDYIPQKTVDVPGFYIDPLPVTNRQYLEFARSVVKEGHLSCHPDEPSDKDHWPAHLRDPRFGGDDFPVTGIDWYDAYAYAGWLGKQIPSEIQWEKAARGTKGYEYPWGNEWRDGLVNSVETTFGIRIETLDQWEEVLRSVSAERPVRPLWPVGFQREADSPYGVGDMAGNVWEWTRTNFFSRQPMDPFFHNREVLEFTNRPEAFPVIRGGCWTSLPEMMRTFYRGKDLLTDRHFEIGFRCVVEEAANPSPEA